MDIQVGTRIAPLSLLLLPTLAFAEPSFGDGACDPATDSLGTLVAAVSAVMPEPPEPPRTRAPDPEPAPRADTLPFHIAGLDDEKLETALRAYHRADAAGLVDNPRLTIIDYSLPSTQKRMWVIDPSTGRVILHELVAHGKNSGENMATRFGNVNESSRTSLGVFRTAETYQGKHGYSLKLDGKDPGVNDAARARAIVIHAADYVTPEFARRVGRLGRSNGCPAVSPNVSRKLIDEIRGGSIVTSFGGDDAWIARSPLAHR